MPPTGKAINFWGITIFNFADGKITHEIVAFDNQPLMEQLGYTMVPAAGEKK
jgi:predicted ester cyclase